MTNRHIYIWSVGKYTESNSLNKYALSATDIGEAMKRSASALEVGNNSFEESIGLITAMNEIVQNSENTGNSLKVLSLRLRGAKAELEDMGEDTDGLCDSTSKLREQVKALSGVDIMEDNNTFKSTAQQVKELGEAFVKLDDVSQAALLEIIAGKSRSNAVAALLKNYQQIDNVIADLDDAEGSALRENEAIVDSIDGRIKVLSATAEEFWQKFIDTDFVKNAVSLASDLLGLLTQIIDKFGTLPTILTGIGAVLSFKNVGMFKQLPTMISELNKLGIALKALDGMNLMSVGVNTGNLDAYRSAIKGLSTEQAVFALASKGATEEQIRQILITKQSETTDVEAALAKAGLTTATAALNGQEVIELAQRKGLTAERAKEIASNLGLIATEEGQVVSKKQLTVATLKQAGATDAEIASILGLTVSEGGAIVGTNLLTAAFYKLNRAINSNPWLFVIGAALTAIIASYEIAKKKAEDAEEAIKSAHEEAQQSLDSTKSDLENSKSELQSVNSELETTKQKIQDIASQDSITLTEQNELDKLSTANTQLETQKSLLENNLKLKQKSAALDAKKLLGTQVEMNYSDIQDGKDIVSHKESHTYAEHAKYEASNLKNAYNIYMSALKDGDAEKQKLAQELIDAAGGHTAELTSSLLEIVESFKYDDGTIIEGYEDLYNQYMGLIYNLQSLTNPEMFLDIAKQATEGTNIDYEKAISDGYAMAYAGDFDIDKLNQDFVKVLADNGIDKSTIEYIFKLKQQEYQNIVDNINQKYNPENVLRPTYLEEPNHVDTPEQSKQKERDNQLYEQQKQEVQKVNDELTEYAKENPVEFQLVTSYDEDFTTLDKYIAEERKKALQEGYGDSVDYVDKAINRLVEEAKKAQNAISDEGLFSFSTLFDGSDFGDRLTYLSDQFKAGKISAHDYFESIRSELANTDFSEFTDQAAAAQQFFTDSIQQISSSLSDLINNYSNGKISATEYLDGYLSMAETLSDLTDSLQENSAAWNENGEAISNGTSQSLDTTQSRLTNAIQGIEQYQDSIYSLEQIMSGTIKSGTDEFTAHTQVIAEDLAYIVQTGGKMAEQIASAMGTTTEEIASSLTDNVDNQAIAAQAIATNTNTSIGQMAQAVGNLLDTLGESIKNFKVDITFGVKGITAQDANLGILGKVKIPAIKFGITASGESLNVIGDAVSSFGKTLMSNISSQMVDYKKFSSIPTDSKGNEKTYTPSKDVTNNYNNKLNDIKNADKADKAAKDAAKAAEDAHKAAKEELDAYLKYEKARFDAGLISYKDYMDKRLAITNKYYNEEKITAEEYYTSIQEMYEEQLSIYDKVLSAISSLIDEEIDKLDKSTDAINKKNDALNEEKEKYDNIISAVEDVYDTEIDRINELIDALEEQNDKLSEEQENYDNILSAIDKVYDDQIKAYEDEQQKIQDIIDGLQDSNDEREREIALMKAKYELERAQNQRTQYVYQDGQMVYKADESAIRDAKEALDDAEFDKTISDLEKQIEEIDKNIDALNKMKEKWQEIANARKEALEYQAGVDMFGDKFTEYILNSGDKDIDAFLEKYNKVLDTIDDNTELIKGYNEKIKYYEKLKKNWTDLSSQHEKNINKQIATEKFGAEWEKKVLEGRLEDFDSFKNRYLAIQDEVTNNEKLLKDLEEKKTYYEELKEQWSSVSSAYEDGMEKQIAAMMLGEDWEKKVLDNRKGLFEDFKNNYINIQHQIANATIDAANAAMNAANTEAQAVQNSLGNTVGYINTVSDEYKKAAKDMEEVTKNLSNQQKALSKFGTNGRFGTVEKFAKGGVVGESNDPTVKKLAQSMGEDTLVAAKVGERILTPEQSKHFEELVDAKTGATYTPVNIIKKLGRVDMERAMQNMRSAQSNLYSNLVANNNAVNSSAIPNYVKEVNVDQHITLTLPNVTNNAGVEYLQKTLNNMTQKAYQMINKH